MAKMILCKIISFQNNKMTGIPVVDDQLYAELIKVDEYATHLFRGRRDTKNYDFHLLKLREFKKKEQIPFIIIPIAKLGFTELPIECTWGPEKFKIPHNVRDALLHEKLYMIYASLIRRESSKVIEQSIKILERKDPNPWAAIRLQLQLNANNRSLKYLWLND
jgi:hypothetical protein